MNTLSPKNVELHKSTLTHSVIHTRTSEQNRFGITALNAELRDEKYSAMFISLSSKL
jgi:hypothetical protein